ncbi:MAG: hypothetical protein DRJ40_09160 [Thermoprotei archaeon]|nr:MAG: hypothetical protein DRJ40_09160 [Thermoprotei archaeon]
MSTDVVSEGDFVVIHLRPKLLSTYAGGREKGIVIRLLSKLLSRVEGSEIPKPQVEEELSDLELKIYRYIVAHRGRISISRTAYEFGITEEQLKEIIRKLIRLGKLRAKI